MIETVKIVGLSSVQVMMSLIMMYCYGKITVCYWEISPDNIIVITSQTKHKECDS